MASNVGITPLYNAQESGNLNVKVQAWYTKCFRWVDHLDNRLYLFHVISYITL